MGEKVDSDELLKKLQEEVENMSVKELMEQMAANLASLGFRYLGAAEGKEKDLSQAKLAIDGVSALYNVLEKELSVQEKAVLSSALSNLRLMYVQSSE